MNVEQARFNMIEQQIRPWDVLDTGVLSLLSLVKREDFVPAEHQALAFMDTEIPLGGGRYMAPPRVEARLFQELKVARHEKVLEIGTGAGYVAALLGHKAQSVISLESDAELAKAAAERLKRAGVLNVKVQVGEGAQGLAAEAPFDVILLSGSVAAVPQVLLDQLKPGGRLVAVVGELPVMTATLFTRNGGAIERRALFDCVLPRLAGFAEPSGFKF